MELPDRAPAITEEEQRSFTMGRRTDIRFFDPTIPDEKTLGG